MKAPRPPAAARSDREPPSGLREPPDDSSASPVREDDPTGAYQPVGSRLDRDVVSERVNGLPAEWTPDILRIMNRIVFAGCLAMVYMACCRGSAQIEFARKLGADDFHFGVLGAIPPAMLLLQFAGGMVVNRLRYRKTLWISIFVFHRMLVVPLSLLPWFFPDYSPLALVWIFLGLSAFGQGLSNFGQPMWFSWMADLLPKRSLNEFWARRRRWLALCQAGGLLGSAAFFHWAQGMDIRVTFPVVAALGAVAGVWDILLFLKVPEPPVTQSEHSGLRLLQEPFRDRMFRRFIIYSCLWTFAAMAFSPFIGLYLLKVHHMPLDHLMLLMFFHALGGTLFASSFGKVADKWGQRPVIILCTALKSSILIALFFVRPEWIWLLVPVFLFDNMLNTGLMVARNGFMLKQSPQANRSMFVASLLACSGLFGALGSLSSGAALQALDGFVWAGWGVAWTNFHVVLLGGIVLRWLSIGAAWWIHEPDAESPKDVLAEVVGPGMLRWLRTPLGYFSRRFGAPEDET